MVVISSVHSDEIAHVVNNSSVLTWLLVDEKDALKRVLFDVDDDIQTRPYCLE